MWFFRSNQWVSPRSLSHQLPYVYRCEGHHQDLWASLLWRWAIAHFGSLSAMEWPYGVLYWAQRISLFTHVFLFNINTSNFTFILVEWFSSCQGKKCPSSSCRLAHTFNPPWRSATVSTATPTESTPASHIFFPRSSPYHKRHLKLTGWWHFWTFLKSGYLYHFSILLLYTTIYQLIYIFFLTTKAK